MATVMSGGCKKKTKTETLGWSLSPGILNFYLGGSLSPGILNFYLGGSLSPGILNFYLLVMKRIQLRSVLGKGAIPDSGSSANSLSTSCSCLCSLLVYTPFPGRKGWNTHLSEAPAHTSPACTVLF